jgi:hypothetical protein
MWKCRAGDRPHRCEHSRRQSDAVVASVSPTDRATIALYESFSRVGPLDTLAGLLVLFRVIAGCG